MSHTFPRGFKANAEKQSLAIRQRFKLGDHQACQARWATKLHDVSVTPVGSLIEVFRQELQDRFPNHVLCTKRLAWVADPNCEFFAIAVKIRELKMIFYNESRSAARQESDIMHELSHLLCDHKGDVLELSSGISLRSHNEAHEQEAGWLGAALQVPEAGLLHHVRAGRTSEEIAALYGASLQMVTYRRGILGIDKRIAFEKAKKLRAY